MRLTSCPLVQSLTVFLLLQVAGSTGGQIRWPHLRSDWRPRRAIEIPFVKAGKVAVVQTGSLLSFSITSLVQLTRMGSLAGYLDNSKSLLGIPAGLGLASPTSDQELNSMVGSSVGYLLEKSARRWCQMKSLEPFLAEIWPDLPEGVC